MVTGRGIAAEVATWLPVGVIPIANGIVRVMTYGPALGPTAGALVSSLLDIMLICAYAALVERRWPAGGLQGGLARGCLWTFLSTVCHFLLGRFAFGLSWQSLLLKYDVAAGETWLLITLAIGAAPVVAAATLRRRARTAKLRGS